MNAELTCSVDHRDEEYQGHQARSRLALSLSLSVRLRRFCSRVRTAASSGRKAARSSLNSFSTRFLGLEQQRALDVGRDDLRVDITFAANGRRVAEPRRHLLDGVADIALGAGLAVEFLELLQRHGSEHRAVPGSKVLGRDVLAADLA
jgi:hypothetical protein